MSRREDAEWRANEAARILDEPLLVEALAQLEQDAMEEALRVPAWHRWGRKRRDTALQRIHVIRDLRSRLNVLISIGKQAARRP